MASSYMPLWKRLLRKCIPALFWTCPAGNYHWRWNNRICYCRVNEHCAPEWHGGVWVDGKELFARNKTDETGPPPSLDAVIAHKIWVSYNKGAPPDSDMPNWPNRAAKEIRGHIFK